MNLKNIKISGISLPIYLLISALILGMAHLEMLPNNMMGALAILMVLGGLFNTIGNNLPIVKSYLGGGAVFCIFASSALATFNLIPSSVVTNCENFMNGVGFLDLYIAALITGSILGMNRKLLIRAAVRFLPVSFISMACAILMSGLVGMLLGHGFADSILYIAMPMMSGGMGAGVIPLSGIYANATGIQSAAIISRMIPASALGNVLAIICAALLAKLGNVKPNLSGNGQLMKTNSHSDEEVAENKLDYIMMGTGLLVSIAFFAVGVLVNKFIPNVHAYAFMIIIVVICKVAGIIPKKYEQAAVQWSQFVMKNLTTALLAGIGVTLLDLKLLGASITPSYLMICVSIILTVALCSAIGGKLVGFYPIESAITAGLCTNSMGGTGNIAVLSAADRMELIPFAQMATRIGGALILIISSFMIQIFG
ncbi:2-hydroxycarboxylate transporter family protein [Anaeromicropila herbilytica]|uniref:Citrate:sodium symporter n=1 Tax=Anaeromicropila herbilytica TaxID=2785025 RepID=A0A7R7EME3_9FIRM|nr:2-hydroxycarboxylate transporter family protein [Anaeromicropila herbilytica]BCN31494.1 citrate:sodium symporter [Anaeromicropila herbilytica]